MPINILMPALSPTMQEGTLARWLLNEGDSVKSGSVIAEIETDKATMELEAVDDGILGKILVAEGTEGIKVSEVIAILLEEGENSDSISPPPLTTEISEATPSTQQPASKRIISAQDDRGKRVFVSPLARRVARERGLDLSSIKGSGPRGRIVLSDLDFATHTPQVTAAPLPAKNPTRKIVSAISPLDLVKATFEGREFEEVKLDGMRKIIAARLSEAKQTIPHFYLRRSIILDPLISFRETMNKELKNRDIKLSINDFIIKACAQALQEVPDCNAVWAGDKILRLKASDVAVAVAIEGGLFTPVLKDADKKSISAISIEMKDLASRARARNLGLHEYQGGTISISNLGMMGVESFDAVINPPHASILAVGAGILKPVVAIDGEIRVATVMSVTLSVDHRVIDGAIGSKFLEIIKNSIEHPVSMLA